MEKIYDLILNNIYLFCLLMIVIFIIIILIICLIKSDKDKKSEKEEEIDNTLKTKEELENITDEEIEKRFMENYLEEQKENIEEEITNSNIENILEELKQAPAPTPSEALKKFEEEQEEQAIISYQQLVESVKNNKISIKNDEEEYFHDDIKTTEDVLTKIDQLSQEYEEEPIKEIGYNKKDYSYKPNEFISPVFGRMDSSNVLYRQGLEYTNKSPKKQEYKINTETEILASSNQEERSINNFKREYKEYNKLDAEEFLKNLKDFRNKL